MSSTIERPTFHTGAAELILREGAPRKTWLAARRPGIGGSDIAAILGMSRWSSPYQVWLDKTGRATEEPETWPMFRGTYDEPKLRAWFTRQTGIEVATTGTWRSVDHPLALANPDALTGDDGGLECKSHSWRMGEEWDDDQVSDGAELQSQWYAGVLGLDHWWVCAQIGDDEPLIRRIEADRALFATLVEAAERFWHDYVEADREPGLSAIDLPVVKDRYRSVDLEATEAPDPARVRLLLAERAAAKAAEKDAAAIAARAEAELLSILGHAEALTIDGAVVLTAKANGTFAPTRLTADHPDVAEAFTTTRTVLDIDRLKTERADLYAAYRARVLRVPTTKEK